jgi:hypothetical protein
MPSRRSYKKRTRTSLFRRFTRSKSLSRGAGLLRSVYSEPTQIQQINPANTLEGVKSLLQKPEGIPENQTRLVFKTEDSWRIITRMDPEFEVAIIDAPTLKKIRPKISNYHYDYLVQILRNFSYADSHKAYLDATKTAWCYVFVLSQVIAWLNEEIRNIQTIKESSGYAFTNEDSKIIITELEMYIDYFTKNATSWDRFNTAFLEVLFD